MTLETTHLRLLSCGVFGGRDQKEIKYLACNFRGMNLSYSKQADEPNDQ
jgi:hypothetical protein